MSSSRRATSKPDVTTMTDFIPYDEIAGGPSLSIHRDFETWTTLDGVLAFCGMPHPLIWQRTSCVLIFDRNLNLHTPYFFLSNFNFVENQVNSRTLQNYDTIIIIEKIHLRGIECSFTSFLNFKCSYWIFFLIFSVSELVHGSLFVLVIGFFCDAYLFTFLLGLSLISSCTANVPLTPSLILHDAYTCHDCLSFMTILNLLLICFKFILIF